MVFYSSMEAGKEGELSSLNCAKLVFFLGRQRFLSEAVSSKSEEHNSMGSGSENVFPIHGKLLQKAAKEKMLSQKGMVFWLTGLSGAGKSTLAQHLEKNLHEKGHFCKVLDGDNIRAGICRDLGFSLEDRKENIRRVAEVARLFADGGVVTICSFISPTYDIRKMATEIVGADQFREVFIECNLDVCEQRDTKGLYKKARNHEIKDFTGIHSPYHEPVDPALRLNTSEQSVEESSAILFDFVLKEIGLG